LSKLSISNSAQKAVLGLAISSFACFIFAWLPAAAAPQAPKNMQAPDLSAPQGVLTSYVNDLSLPGWQPQPFYMWTLGPGSGIAPPVVAPAAQALSVSALIQSGPAWTTAQDASSGPTKPAADTGAVAKDATSGPTKPASPNGATATAISSGPTTTTAPDVPAPGASAEAGPRSVRSLTPTLPDGDTAREAILAEYSLTGFFRKTFKRGQRYIYIDVYNFQNAEGAYGAYNFLRKGSTTVLPRGDAASEDDNSISFVQGKTFLSVYATSHDDDESKEVLSKVASQAVNYMGEKGSQPAVLNRLPQLDLLHGSEKIVMGPYSVRRFFPAPYLNSLVLDNGRAVGCVADYQMQEPTKERLKLLVLTFKMPSDAVVNYQNFLKQVAQARNTDASTMISQSINVFKTGATYLAIEQRGADLLMIIGARKRFSPALVLHQVR
jgi:hypothetical protein